MKITDLNSGLLFGLEQLNEANVINVDPKMEYEGYSIKKYVESYLQYLTSDLGKKNFTKKLGKLFLNDERYHTVVRQLPPNAPEWATQAMKKKELVYFKPDAALDDAMMHMAHYVAALEHDAASPNNDIKANANREMAGFIKAENLELLAKKSQEYFKRGTKKTDRSEEGMVQIHDSGNGFKWFLLQTPEAYQREGKALQNCIGSYYTRANSQDRGFEIVVMRKGNNESVVAARVNNEKHEIEEMKGKNNRPPVEKYMPHVLDFINKNKFKLNSTAEHDFRRAGYFWIDGQMHTRPQAIKRYIKKDTIAKLPDGNELIRVKTESSSSIVKDLLKDLYPDLAGYNKTPEIYELRNSDDIPLVSGSVENKKLEKLLRHSSLRECLIESVVKGRAAREFVGELFRRGYIDSVNDKMARDLFWNERMKINSKTGTFDQVKPEKDIHTDSKHLPFEKHSDDDTVKMIKQSLKSSGSGNWGGDDDKWDPMGINQVYIGKDKLTDSEHDDFEAKAKVFALAKTKDNTLIPITIHNDRVSTTDIGTGIGSERDGTDSQVRRSKFINSAVALANAEDAELTKSFAYNSGIVKEKGKYKVYDPVPQKLPGDPPGMKIDLSTVPLSDRFAAINRVVITGGVRTRDMDNDNKDSDYIHDHDTEVQLKLDYALGGKKYARGQSLWQSVTQEDASNWEGHDVDELYKKVFNGDTPDTIYLVKVTYGSNKAHEVFMLSDGHKVVEIDGATERHEFQSWGDHEVVANQLNDFADKNGLTFDKDAVGDKEELRIHKGRFATGSMVQKQQLADMAKKGDIGTEGTDEVVFEDGSKVVRMDHDEQAEWVRRGPDLRSLAGEGWKVTNTDGDHIGVVVVHKGSITTIYGPEFDWDSDTGSMIPGKGLNDMSNKQSITPDLLNAVVGAKKNLKWKTKESDQFSIEPNSDHHKVLKSAEENKDVRENAFFHKVYDLGFISASDSEKHSSKTVTLTPSGKAALKKLDGGSSANALSLGQGSKLA